MVATEMTYCGRWVCFGTQRQGFSSNPRTTQKIDFTPTPGGWDLTMKLEQPERQQNVEHSDSGDQRKEKGSCSNQRLWSDH